MSATIQPLHCPLQRAGFVVSIGIISWGTDTFIITVWLDKSEVSIIVQLIAPKEAQTPVTLSIVAPVDHVYLKGWPPFEETTFLITTLPLQHLASPTLPDVSLQLHEGLITVVSQLVIRGGGTLLLIPAKLPTFLWFL